MPFVEFDLKTGMKSEEHRELIQAVIRSAETLNPAHFLSTLTDEATLRIGSNVVVRGLSNIKKSTDDFFSMLSEIRHRVHTVGDTADTIFYEGEVTYTLKSGKAVTLPYCNALHLKDGLIEDFRMYIDRAPLGL